jgi:conjugative relaxase-like TrwC/TraI family protein
MLRVTTLYASSAAATAGYYTQYLAQAVGEQPGVWSGVQADRLGIGGAVGSDALQLLLEGRDPGTGTPLGSTLSDRFRTDGSVVRAVAGFDATFSAPKSVSVLWALTGDERILAVHDQAVTAALAHFRRSEHHYPTPGNTARHHETPASGTGGVPHPTSVMP